MNTGWMQILAAALLAALVCGGLASHCHDDCANDRDCHGACFDGCRYAVISSTSLSLDGESTPCSTEDPSGPRPNSHQGIFRPPKASI